MERWAAMLSEVPAWHFVSAAAAVITLSVVLEKNEGSLELAGAILIVFAVFRSLAGVIALAKKGLQTLRGEL